MTARYAVYYAPRQDSRLWAKASAWLGRDAYDGRDLKRPALPGLEGLDLDALTADPRGYGFHATLKAPFELASDQTEAELVAFTRAFAAARSSFSARIEPARLGRFHAFRLSEATPGMDDLHAACVRDFEPFRAPLSDHDLTRRRKAKLTPEQDQRLVAWGYPYVFEDFRFHMTLSSSIADDMVSRRLGVVLADWFQDEAGPHLFDGVALFKQPDRASPFFILERADFA